MKLITILPKEKHHGAGIPAEVLLMLRMQFHQLESVGLYMESDVRATNRAELYVLHEGSPDTIVIKKQDPMGKVDKPAVVFHCNTGMIQYDIDVLTSVFPQRDVKGIWLAILELLARVEQTFLNNDAWMFQTQINWGTRKILKDFYKLVKNIAGTSSAPVIVSDRKEHHYAIRSEKDNIAIYDQCGVLVIRLSVDSFELGPQWAGTTDFDGVLRNIVKIIRPVVLTERDRLQEILKPLRIALGTLEWTYQDVIKNATEAAKVASPDAPAVEVPGFETTFGKLTIVRDGIGWHVGVPLGPMNPTRGWIASLHHKKKIQGEAKAMDSIRRNNIDFAFVQAGLPVLEQSLTDHITKTFMDVLQKHDLEVLGIDQETYERYSQAYMIARNTGYQKDFQTFAKLLKVLL